MRQNKRCDKQNNIDCDIKHRIDNDEDVDDDNEDTLTTETVEGAFLFDPYPNRVELIGRPP